MMTFSLWLGVAALIAGVADTIGWAAMYGLRVPFRLVPFKATVAAIHTVASIIAIFALVALLLGRAP